MYSKIIEAEVPAQIKDTYLGVRFSASLLVGKINSQGQNEGRVLQEDLVLLRVYNMMLNSFSKQILNTSIKN